jgi:threonyl-tRNA synthetase
MCWSSCPRVRTSASGPDEVWDRAEAALAAALDAKGLKYELQPGEGAFYGPKIEFSLKDSLNASGNAEPCSSISRCPGRLGAEYVAEDNSRRSRSCCIGPSSARWSASSAS